MQPKNGNSTIRPYQTERDQRAGGSIPPAGDSALPTTKPKLINRLPRWSWLVLAALALLLILSLPSVLRAHPGFTLVIKGAPPGSQVYVDDVPRGIPGVVLEGNNVAGVIRVHGLKHSVEHAVRVGCGSGGNATLYLDNGSAVTQVRGDEGQDINIMAKNCEQPPPTPLARTEIDYKGKMRFVAAGAFLMGDDEGQPNERPAHVVNLDYDYYIDKFEVTNQQYRDFCNVTSRRFPSEPKWDASYSAKLDHPIVGVSWNDARDYCDWAGKKLPTEQEWEKAASWDPQATDATIRWKRRWPWGNDFGQGQATFNTTHPTAAGQHATGASAYGVHDLAGNIGEWVVDAYNKYPNSSATDSNFGGPYRVLRGSTFVTGDADGLRTTRRGYRPPTFQTVLGRDQGADSYIGFRCVVRRDDSGLQAHLKQMGQAK